MLRFADFYADRRQDDRQTNCLIYPLLCMRARRVVSERPVSTMNHLNLKIGFITLQIEGHDPQVSQIEPFVGHRSHAY